MFTLEDNKLTFLLMMGGRKMENKNLDSYGYLLNCPDEMLGNVNKTMNDKRAIINWNNFNVVKQKKKIM